MNGLTVLANKGHIKYDKIDKSEITSMVTKLITGQPIQKLT